MDIVQNDEGMYDISGKEPVRITFLSSDKVVYDGVEYENVDEVSVIVKGGFNLKNCEGIIEGKDQIRIYNAKDCDCFDVELDS